MSLGHCLKSNGENFSGRLIGIGRALALAMGVLGMSASACFSSRYHVLKPSRSSVCVQKHGNYEQRYCTTAHERLDLETGLGVTESEYKALDDIIREAEKRLCQLTGGRVLKRTERRFMRALKITDDILNENGFKKKKSVGLLSDALREKVIDCDTAAFIYLAVAEATGIPLHVVRKTNKEKHSHLFLRCDLGNDRCVTWETLIRNPVDDRLSCYSCPRPLEKRPYDCTTLPNMSRDELLAVMYSITATEWRKRGNIDKAIGLFETSLRFNPDDPFTLNNMGVAFVANGEIDKAIECYRKVISSNPDHFKSLLNMGLALMRKDDFDSAINYLNRAEALSQDNHLLYLHRGFAWDKKQEYGRALENYERALELKPGYQRALEARQKALQKKKEFERMSENVFL